MSLRNRPRIRWIVERLKRLNDWHNRLIEEGQREYEGEAEAFVAPYTERLTRIREQHLVNEQWAELRRALDECRAGNLDADLSRPLEGDNRPWAWILYERTIDPNWRATKARGALPYFMVYGVEPEDIGSNREEIWEFWMQCEALKANRWIAELFSGNRTHAHSLLNLCEDYGTDFVLRLDASWNDIKWNCPPR